ncbi:MAG: ankyrin repeat domain-containing protein [Bacteroidota bacterium]
MKTISGIIFMVVMLALSVTMSSQDLYQAVADGDLVLVKELLTKNPDLLNAKNADAFTPLNMACERGQAGATEKLLALGADPYIGDNENSMPIHLAAISGNVECIDLLLNHGVDINIQDDNGMTPLLFALSRRNLASLHLIDKGADINLRSNNGWSPIHMAIAARSQDVAIRLLEMGANVNMSLESGATPLHSAVSFGNIGVVKTLIERGAKIDAVTDHGEQALSWAVNPNSYETALFLIQQGADVGHKNGHGATWLHNIAGRGTAFGIAELAMDRGIDVNAQDNWGRTPLYMAAWSNDPDNMSKFLILNGAEVNPSDCMDEKTCACFPNFSTPLHAAVRHGQFEMAKNLVASGAKVNIYNHEGQTPLHCAVQSGDPEIVEYLIKKGAFINIAEQKQGSSELHLAVAMGYTDISTLLIEHGANPDAEDKCGKTPFDYAMYYKHTDLGYELLATGASDEKLSEYLAAPYELDDVIAYGDAKVWFLGHSGWAIKTQNHFLIFDYFCNTWNRKADDSCLASGYVIPAQLKDENVTVFSTHAHGDHYDARIFNWKEMIPNIEYVLCWNQNAEGNDYTLIPVHEEKQLEDMNIYVHHSTDLGGGYLIEVDGLTLLHMGDHANGEDGLMAEFTDEIDILKERTENIDILFGGIRGCSLGEPEQVKKGLYYTLETLQPKLFVPMHGGAHTFVYKDFVETAKADGIKTDMKYVIHKGDRFKYSKDGKGEVSAL